MAEHTPTPWTKDKYANIMGQDGKDVQAYNWHVNSDFIVRSVNAHEALVDAIRTTLARVDHTNIHTTLKDMHDTWEYLRTALALAEGKQ